MNLTWAAVHSRENWLNLNTQMKMLLETVGDIVFV
tara:strand:- start:713 stop:817 length:105 start_codon:yes stop_codon:yes gene_type:complete